MIGQLTITTPPAAQPLDWDGDIKPGLRLSDDSEKPWLMGTLVPAAAAWCESKTNRALITQTWTLKLPCFPASGGRILLPNPPLSSVTSIKYIDTAGVQQTWSALLWTSDAPSGDLALHGHVRPVYGEVYPTTRDQPDAVEIEFVCGYGAEARNVPGGLRLAMTMVVADKFMNREHSISGITISEVPMSAEYAAGIYLAEAA